MNLHYSQHNQNVHHNDNVYKDDHIHFLRWPYKMHMQTEEPHANDCIELRYAT